MNRSDEVRCIDEELNEIETAIKSFATAPDDKNKWNQADLDKYLSLNLKHSELLKKLADLEWNRI